MVQFFTVLVQFLQGCW